MNTCAESGVTESRRRPVAGAGAAGRARLVSTKSAGAEYPVTNGGKNGEPNANAPCREGRVRKGTPSPNRGVSPPAGGNMSGGSGNGIGGGATLGGGGGAGGRGGGRRVTVCGGCPRPRWVM